VSWTRQAGDIDALLPRVRAPASVARIDEAACIGCALCLAACPVDAIVGTTKLMHTVLRADCIGCELCLPPCPVDCIRMLPAGRAFTDADVARARASFARRIARAASDAARGGSRVTLQAADAGTDVQKVHRQAAIAAALVRARARRARRS
jgi:electron transport complex protein RnfB